MIAFPIVQRELISTLRSPRAMAGQLILVVLLAMLLLSQWPTDAMADLSGAAARKVLRIFGYGLLVGMILIAPVFPATTFVREKQQGTLALLLNSPLNRWQIYFGKFIATLGFVMILLVLSLPAAAACYTMGGIDFTQLVMLYLVLAFTATQYATIGLLVGTYSDSADGALRMTYGIILVLALITLAPQFFLQGIRAFGPMTFGVGPVLIDWLRCLSPAAAVAELLGHSGVGQHGMVSGGLVAERFLILALLCIVGLALWTASRLDFKLFDKARAAGKMTEEMSNRQQWFRRIFYLYDPQRRQNLIPGWANPVTMKEFRSRRFGRLNWIIRFAALCIIICLGMMLASSYLTMEWTSKTVGSILVLLTITLIILATPSLASGLISSELEGGGWQLLQMTPMSSATIVIGKLISVVWILTLLLVAVLPGYVVMYFIDETMQTVIFRSAITMALTALMATLLSAAVSSMFTRTAAATAMSYTILVAMCAGTMLFWLGRGAPFGKGTVEAALLWNPVAAALSMLEGTGFEEYDLIPWNWYIMGGLCVVCVVVLGVQTWRLGRPK